MCKSASLCLCVYFVRPRGVWSSIMNHCCPLTCFPLSSLSHHSALFPLQPRLSLNSFSCNLLYNCIAVFPYFFFHSILIPVKEKCPLFIFSSKASVIALMLIEIVYQFLHCCYWLDQITKRISVPELCTWINALVTGIINIITDYSTKLCWQHTLYMTLSIWLM